MVDLTAAAVGAATMSPPRDPGAIPRQYLRAWWQRIRERRQRRPPRAARPRRRRGGVSDRQRPFPVAAEPRQPLRAEHHLHAAGDGRDLRPAARRDRPLGRTGHGAGRGHRCRGGAARPVSNWPWWLAIIVALLICSAVGPIQGTLVARVKMPSFIVTLGGLLVLEGVAIIVLGGSLVGIGNSRFSNEVVPLQPLLRDVRPGGQLDPAGVVGVIAAGWRGSAMPVAAAQGWWPRRPASPH